MSQSNDNDGHDKPKRTAVAEYLAAPRRKRKSYVVIACSPEVPPELMTAIEGYVRVAFKGMAVTLPKSPEELIKSFTRQIVLLVYDDAFVDLDAGLGMIRELKRKKNSAGIPVLFLTRRANALVQAYNRILLPYHEADEYVDYTRSATPLVLSKVKAGLTTKNRRRSRRYRVDVPLEFFDADSQFQAHREDPYDPGTVLRLDPTSGRMLELDPAEAPRPVQGHRARLIDLSLHGGLIKADDEARLFRLGDQLKLKIPVAPVLKREESEFLKLTAKVQRVFIGGNQAGISFENLSEKQIVLLTRFLSEIVNQQFARKASAIRQKIASATPPKP